MIATLRALYNTARLNLALEGLHTPPDLAAKFRAAGWREQRVSVVIGNQYGLSPVDGFEVRWTDASGNEVLSHPALRATHERIVCQHFGRPVPSQNCRTIEI